jgi:hypothetical protein
MMKTHRIASILILGSLCAGCSSGSNSGLLPSSKLDTKTNWSSYDEAKRSFDAIIPHHTTAEDLKRLGYDPFTTPNITLLTYIELLRRFLPNDSITKADLDEGIQDCFAMKDECKAYEISLKIRHEKRFGNVWLDLLTFRRKTKVTGWEFNAFIVLKGDIVAYKISGGKPRIDELIDHKKPLGPLQDIEGNSIVKAAGW